MRIFLSILSVIGKVLLVILGIIVLLICLVLFVPIRYKAHIVYDGKQYSVDAAVTWLLHFIRFRFHLDNSGSAHSLKIAWKTLLKSPENTENEKVSLEYVPSDEPQHSEEAATAESVSEVSYEAPAEGYEIEAAFEEQFEEETENEEAKEIYEAAKKQPTQTSAREVRKHAKKAVKEERRRRKKGLEDGDIFAEKEQKPTILGRIMNIINKISSSKKLMNQALEAFEEVKKYIVKIIKHILPRRIEGYVRFGFEDPSLTGKICGVIGFFYPVIPEKLSIEPDFTEPVLEADVTISGRIMLFVLLINGLKILLNKKVRALIAKVRGKKQKKVNKSRRRRPAFG